MPTDLFYDVGKSSPAHDEDVPTDSLVDMDTVWQGLVCVPCVFVTCVCVCAYWVHGVCTMCVHGECGLFVNGVCDLCVFFLCVCDVCVCVCAW